MKKSQKINLHNLQAKKEQGRPITMITAYDFPGARMVDEAEIDMILVGDSLAMTVLGYDSTVSVTMADMLHHCKAVARAKPRAFTVGDMPFLSYQADPVEAVKNAGRLIQEGGMDAVKLEGGRERAATARRIAEAGIAVVGHIGLTPQSVSKLGGYKVQGKTATDAERLLDDALSLQEAGCFMVVLEAVPSAVARTISERLTIPTIGIGAGVHCDGQVLVFHDILGLFEQFVPKFVKQYAQLRPLIIEAFSNYRKEVEAGTFPAPDNGFTMNQGELQRFLDGVGI